jgi:hypothetical protein
MPVDWRIEPLQRGHDRLLADSTGTYSGRLFWGFDWHLYPTSAPGVASFGSQAAATFF